MLSSADDLQRALSLAGWQASLVREKAFRLQDQDLDVTRCIAHRGRLRATVVVLGDCEDGDWADRFASLSRSPLMVSRRAGKTKVQVEVLDGDRALEELEGLLSQGVLGRSFDRVVEGVEARGWRVERDRSSEDTYDHNWQILAQRPGEHLELGAAMIALTDARPPFLHDRGHAQTEFGAALVIATVRSAAHAQELLDAVLAPEWDPLHPSR